MTDDVKIPSGRFAGMSVTAAVERLEGALAAERRKSNALYDVVCAIEAIDPTQPDSADRMRALAAGAAQDFERRHGEVTPGRLARRLRRQNRRARALTSSQ